MNHHYSFVHISLDLLHPSICACRLQQDMTIFVFLGSTWFTWIGRLPRITWIYWKWRSPRTSRIQRRWRRTRRRRWNRKQSKCCYAIYHITHIVKFCLKHNVYIHFFNNQHLNFIVMQVNLVDVIFSWFFVSRATLVHREWQEFLGFQ